MLTDNERRCCIADSHKACPTFVNQGGICVFRRILENRSNYSEDGILTLMTCIGLITAHWNLRNHCIESGIIPALLNAAQNSKSPQVIYLQIISFMGNFHA